ncbi:MAG: tRNA 2-thiouridine(34) synthase MnmA [Candidatus Latescibacterota bacterium]|nr:MAG: tRNA 2-thiouridine(34) synthase MnmA [Candidatus Latescibacterota bacterium]
MNGRFVDINDDERKSEASVLVSMSGGVDSAVAALLVTQAGYRTVGLTMKNYCYGDADVPDRSCCSIESIEDAKRECDRLDIPHRVADVEEVFARDVIDNFLGEYQNARTPNPCVRCNSIVRFEALISYADRLGIDLVATGHYARVFEADNGSLYMARSVNRDKDQSYFLSGVHGDMLRRVLFPLGTFDKQTVRKTAESAELAVAHKKESQEVCFVPEGTLRSFLVSNGVDLTPGPIEDTNGRVLGEHDGLAQYTVGQRRRLGIATGIPQYVVRLDRRRNALVVGGEDELFARELTCTLAWIDPHAATDSVCVTAQIRYRHRPASVKRIHIEKSRCRVVFEEPQRAICPGQTVGFYRGDIVVGSGVIDDSRYC